MAKLVQLDNLMLVVCAKETTALVLIVMVWSTEMLSLVRIGFYHKSLSGERAGNLLKFSS